jgi:hypothetical protein
MLTAEEAEVLKEDLKTYERIKRQYNEMIRINEDKIT